MNVYEGLVEQDSGDGPWAFGTGFAAAEIVEVDAPPPAGVDAADLAEYCLMLGDDALVYSHRLTEWVASAPELEEEVALANIALDLLGQARALLARAGRVEGAGRDEDALAYWRDESEFRCVRLVELDDERDFARCVARLLVFATWRLALLRRLADSADPAIAAVAAKGVPEVSYHRDYAAGWVLRLGDGTPESHERMSAALAWAWPWVEELYWVSGPESRLAGAGVAADPAGLRGEVEAVLREVVEAATLAVPEVRRAGAMVGRAGRQGGAMAGRAGRQGAHTEHLGPVLAVSQSLAREHRGAVW